MSANHASGTDNEAENLAVARSPRSTTSATYVFGLLTGALLQCFDMTDWRQIQARIRKAKNSPDAHTKLSELFLRTHDGMVAWELGVVEEKAARIDEAVKWYTIAAERFRRAEWKKKAQEALTRLGAPLPAETAGTNLEGNHLHTDETHSDSERETAKSTLPLAYGEIPEAPESEEAEASAASPESAAGADSALVGKKKRRRGRRGGRGRRRKEASAPPPLPSQAFAESSEAKPQHPAQETFRRAEPRPAFVERPAFDPPVIETPRRAPVEPPAMQLPSERTAHGRAGDPALASRMAQLESMLRRLVSSPLHRLDDVDHAPAGPGVFLLSDSDQITSYYIESCQTLRVGLGNLVRGNRAGKNVRGGRGYSESGLKSKLAEHLGINESKVSQYMKDHCVVRWIQLDDDAAHLAHFAIGVLRTPLNLD
jgi:hypothetical protein